MAKSVRLLKMFVQTVWVEIEEDGQVVEQADSGVWVPAKAWPDFFPNWQRQWEQLVATREAPEDDEAPIIQLPPPSERGTRQRPPRPPTRPSPTG